MTPPRQTPAKPAAGSSIAERLGLSADELDDLRDELLAEGAPRGVTQPNAGPRKLTPRELAIRALLRERDHLEACPLFADESRTAGRVEAYGMTAPADDQHPTDRPVTVARCMDCGGDRILEGTPAAVLLEAIGGPAAEPVALDGTLA